MCDCLYFICAMLGRVFQIPRGGGFAMPGLSQTAQVCVCVFVFTYFLPIYVYLPYLYTYITTCIRYLSIYWMLGYLVAVTV